MTQGEPVVITGIGLALPPGIDRDRVTVCALEGASAIGPVQRFAVAGHACGSAGEVPPFDLMPLRLPKNIKFMSRSVTCAMHAARGALAQAGSLDALDPRRIAFHTGSGQTGLEPSEFFGALDIAESGDEAATYRNLGGRAARMIDRFWSLRTLSNAGLGLMAAEFSARGPCNNYVQGDTASAQALGAGYFDLLEGRCDVALAGGYDCLLTPSNYLAFERAGLLSASAPERAYRPFDRDRDGLVLAEGAAFVVMERREHARARGATVLGELLGVGLAQGAGDRATAASIDAVRAAIRDAGGDLSPDVVIAHGIGTRPADCEEAALLERLGYGKTPVTAMKGLTGYLGAATAAAELCIGVLTARERAIPPVARLVTPDDACRLDFVVKEARPLVAATPSLLAFSWSWSGQCSVIAARAIPA